MSSSAVWPQLQFPAAGLTLGMRQRVRDPFQRITGLDLDPDGAVDDACGQLLVQRQDLLEAHAALCEPEGFRSVEDAVQVTHQRRRS